ncbi:hypothetical protein [uncultured Ruegeria sp.]|uniref:hypothetical protein n=1 Tax=uncultured Ruegeria sp. TaxID=259304 RepID=UPI0026079801|nr:hypothetical protein [uncultured Ruegeria sp.]
MLKGNRTRLFALLLILVGILETYGSEVVGTFVPPEYQGLAITVIGIIVLILRQITTSAPGRQP